MTKYFDDVFTLNVQNCGWLPMNQFLFQLANGFLVLTYVVKPNTLGGLMQLRFVLMMAGLCFGIWGYIIICALDCAIWNLAFAIGNAVHLVYLIVKTRPAKFSPDHEQIYARLFEPVGVKRFQYNNLTLIANILNMDSGQHYATKGVTESNHIGIIVSGSIKVELSSDKVINHIDAYEFVDSPEWIATDDNTPTTYQVSLIAKEETKVLVWRRDDLNKLFKQDNMIKNIFDSLIGKDICKKLFSVHQVFLTNQSNENKISSLLHQAPLLTYSAANLFQVISNEPSPREETKHDLDDHVIQNGAGVTQDVEICLDDSNENTNLILNETNL